MDIIIPILLILLVGALIYYVAREAMAAFKIGDPIRRIVLLIIVVLIVVAIIRESGLLF